MQQPGEKLTDFLGSLPFSAMKPYAEESKESRNELIVRGLQEEIQNNQTRLGFREGLVEAELAIKTALEKELHI